MTKDAIDWCSESEWLIAMGWRPSPTTITTGGAWEHEELSRVPTSCRPWAEEQGLFDPRWIRHTTAQASAIMMAMDALAEVAIILPRAVLEGQL
jgi:hypothetical protein